MSTAPARTAIVTGATRGIGRAIALPDSLARQVEVPRQIIKPPNLQFDRTGENSAVAAFFSALAGTRSGGDLPADP